MIKIKRIISPRGSITVPGDKSISHRAVMMASIARGKSRLKNVLLGQDCASTIDAFRRMGISIDIAGDTVYVEGRGLKGLSCPDGELYLGNSGTTIRLLSGILAGQGFEALLTGDSSLLQRPMKRVIKPLRLMGVDISGAGGGDLAPIRIKGPCALKAIDYMTEVASAQVKSAIMFAALYAKGRTTVTEPYTSRDHTERMFRFFGIDIEKKGLSVSVCGAQDMELAPRDIDIPGDISSAAFFMALGALSEGACIRIDNCGLNPTRAGMINVLKDMGADIEIIQGSDYFEPAGSIIIRYSQLRPIKIAKHDLPLMIDEIPLIALCATQAKGISVIEDVSELRVKETDRAQAIMTNLKGFGADLHMNGNNLIIKGPTSLKGVSVQSYNDHRMAMMSVIAGAVSRGVSHVSGAGCIDVSFPGFLDTLSSLTK
ncbi:MAG: 3-phosphoshikimate 1-carboxyvinyltransferase [Candidatus Omnitrophota bacterium]|jgi:3-phosphoshikimate 1-carboxyvinyltransferase